MNPDRTRMNILLSCTGEAKKNFDPFVEDHVIIFILSGSMLINDGQDLTAFRAGDIGFISKNQLLKTKKTPSADKPFMSISIFLPQDVVKAFAFKNNRRTEGRYTGKQNMVIKADTYLKGYFKSMIPYFDNPMMLTKNLAAIKTDEVIELLTQDRRFQNILFDFEELFKIDLEAYMNRNYIHNIPLEQFAKLTGRSLSTFKRDFNDIFQVTPNQWLIRKRLELAHYLIMVQDKKPSDVYYEVGFVNFSHFSKSFKNVFGVSPSTLTTSCKTSD